MTPCTCNTEMGDTCPKCAPPAIVPPKVGDKWGDLSPEQRAMVPVWSEVTRKGNGVPWKTVKQEEGRWLDERHGSLFVDGGLAPGNVITRLGPAPQPASDREGWPVLVRTTEGDYWWVRDEDRAIFAFGTGKWIAWECGEDGKQVGIFASAALAADAIHARLPEEVSTPASVDPRDAEIATLRADYATVSEERTGWRNRATDLRTSCLAILGEPSNSDLTDAGIVDKLRTRIVRAETHIAMHPGRYG